METNLTELLEYQVQEESAGLVDNPEVQEESAGLVDRLKDKVVNFDYGKHLTDVIGGATTGSPFYAYLETHLGGLSRAESGYNKLTGIGISLIGMGSVFSRGRDFSRKKFRVPDKKTVGAFCYRLLHDGAYSTAFALPSSLICYTFTHLFIHPTTWDRIVSATKTNMKFAAIAGFAGCMFIDVYRDFMGKEECKYLPNFIKNRSPMVKKSLAVAMTAASAAGTIAYFSYNQ